MENTTHKHGQKDSSFFTNIFKARTETKILCKIVLKLTVWKRYIHDIF